MKKDKKWFTLIEVLLWILIFTIVILWGFQALSAVNIGKIKLIEKTDITKDVVYFSEKLFEEIKGWGTIDYEEYFNRKIVGSTTSSWHYNKWTGFWNFWSGGMLGTSSYGDSFYYCRSLNWDNMWTWGCFQFMNGKDFSATISWDWFNASLWTFQRYGQYSFQFIDYNSNEDTDWWDQNEDGNIRWDDDDEHLWSGPSVFTGGVDVKEIYLISWDGKKRTLLRWNVKEDPWQNKPTWASCSTSATWSGCLGTIEILKLEGKDWWVNHSSWSISTGSFDWIVDTWIIDPTFWTGSEIVVAGSNNYDYWQPLFPDTINVSDFKVYVYPNIDVKHAWKDTSDENNINPYIRLSMTLEPSWKKRSGMQWEIPKYTINTTINLVDYFTK